MKISPVISYHTSGDNSVSTKKKVIANDFAKTQMVIVLSSFKVGILFLSTDRLLGTVTSFVI